MTDALDLSLPELSLALRERRLRAEALVEAAIARHDRWSPVLNAYAHWAPEAARRSAIAADAAFAAGAIAGPLQGIPVSAKDLFAVAGMPNFAGSSRRLPPAWDEDGPVIAALRRQLAVFTGKTHMVEFAFGGTGYNSHWGTPRNPWDGAAHRAPGGSSSGAGVSLAEGSALLALGTDTAGSVRIPAAMTGQVGLKVTLGRWSTGGIVPLSFSFDTPGLLARSAADAAYGFAAIDGMDPALLPQQAAALSASALTIGIGDPTMWEDCDPGIAEAAQQALDELAQAGARLSAAALPEAVPAYREHVEGGVSAPELLSFLRRELPDWLGQIDPTVAVRIRAAETLSAADYIARLDRLRALARSAARAFDAVDVIAAPTLPITPPTLAEFATPEGNAHANRRIVRNTVVANYLSFCAITLPVGLDRAGLPVGLQLMARGGAEERLLTAALIVESVLGTPRHRLGTPPLLR